MFYSIMLFPSVNWSSLGLESFNPEQFELISPNITVMLFPVIATDRKNHIKGIL